MVDPAPDEGIPATTDDSKDSMESALVLEEFDQDNDQQNKADKFENCK